jgi:hypothetical protein
MRIVSWPIELLERAPSELRDSGFASRRPFTEDEVRGALVVKESVRRLLTRGYERLSEGI